MCVCAHMCVHAMLGSCFGLLMVHNISGEQAQTAEMLLSHCFWNEWGLWVLYVSKGLLQYITR